MADQHEQQQINVPSLVVILVLSGLIIRYLFFSPASSGTGTPSSSRGGNRNDQAALMRSREVAAERILQMFPQVDRRTVLWDLQRTGGNITATTERILRGRLETVSLSSFFFVLFPCLLCDCDGILSWLLRPAKTFHCYSPR